MTQQTVVEAAKRGEPEAIATWLNRALKPHGVFAKVALKNHCLQVLLEAPQLPSPNLVTLIQQRLTNLESLALHQVKIYGKELGSEPQWNREFEIKSNTSVNLDSRDKETPLASNQVNKAANPDTNSVQVESDRGRQRQQPKQSKIQESVQHFEGHFVPNARGVPNAWGFDKSPIRIAGPGQCKLSKQGLEVKAFKQGIFVGFKPALGGLIGSVIVLIIYFILYQVGIIQTINPSFLLVMLIAPIVAGEGLANGDNYQKNKKIEVFFPWNVVEYAKLLENFYSLLNGKTEKSRVVVLRIKQFRHNKILYAGDLHFKPDTEVLMFLEVLRKWGITVFGVEKARAIRKELEFKAPSKSTTSAWLTRIIQKPSTGVIALLVVIAVVFFGAILSPKPQEFKSESGAFSVVVPATFKAEVRSQDLPPLTEKVDFYLFEGRQENVHYMVIYNDFPNELVKRLSPDIFTSLYHSRDRAVQDLNGKLISSSDITLGSAVGVEFVADAEAGYDRYIRVKHRIYFVDNRLYQVGVLAPKFGFNDKEATRYLDSFKLLSK
jgi:hypothetical protein